MKPSSFHYCVPRIKFPVLRSPLIKFSVINDIVFWILFLAFYLLNCLVQMIPVHLIDFSWRDVVSTYRFYQEAKALKDNHELFAYRNGLSFPYVFSLVSYAVICAFFFDTDAILLSSFFCCYSSWFFPWNIINRHNNSLIQVFHNICSYYKQKIFFKKFAQQFGTNIY
jgi:hypothetical protein